MPEGRGAEELAAEFDRHRPRLHAIARRSLGSPWAADDAVQEAWLRLSRADRAAIENLEAWLTTVVSRVAIDMIRAQASRREDPHAELPVGAAEGPEADALRAEDVGLALQVVLDELGPRERLALVLHDVFGIAFEEVAPIVGRSPAATRKLASRARERLRAVDVAAVRSRRAAAVGAFFSAAREGDFGALLETLAPEVEVRSDAVAVRSAASGAAFGAPLLQGTVRGTDAVATAFVGRAREVTVAWVDGLPAGIYAREGEVLAAFFARFEGDQISGIDVVADPAILAALKIAHR